MRENSSATDDSGEANGRERKRSNESPTLGPHSELQKEKEPLKKRRTASGRLRSRGNTGDVPSGSSSTSHLTKEAGGANHLEGEQAVEGAIMCCTLCVVLCLACCLVCVMW